MRDGAWRLRLDRQAIPLEGPEPAAFAVPRRPADVSVCLGGRRSGRPAHRRSCCAGKIAMVGGSAPGMQNPVVTPVDPLFPDVEIQATAIDNLLQGDSFRRPGDARFWELALALLAGFDLHLSAGAAPLPVGSAGHSGLAAGVWAGCAWLLLIHAGCCFPRCPRRRRWPATCRFSPCSTICRRRKGRTGRSSNWLPTQATLAGSAAGKRVPLSAAGGERQRRHHHGRCGGPAGVCQPPLPGVVRAGGRGRSAHVSWKHYVAPEWRAEVRDRHDRRMRGETVPDHFEFEGIRSDGTRIWIEALVTTVEEDGRIIGSQAALRDITERKRMEAQYLQAQKMESIGQAGRRRGARFQQSAHRDQRLQRYAVGPTAAEDQCRAGPGARFARPASAPRS